MAIRYESPACRSGSRINDAPELHARCPRELELALAAKRELERVIAKVELKLVRCATANYGRLCAEGSINGKPLATHMVENHFGAPYVCQPGRCAPKRDWCKD
jgi:hypothetical protein